MANGKTRQFYDMGAMSLNENIHRSLSDFTRENLYIAIPARVISTDDYETIQCLDVQPVINDVYTRDAGVRIEANIISKVFVKLWKSGGWVQKLPVAKGDLVTLHYSHKDLGDWLDSDGTKQVDQSVFGIANLEDCWVELGFGTRKNHNSPSKTDLILEGPETTIMIKPNGDVSVDTSGTSTIKSSNHTIDTNTTITGNLTVNGNTQVDGNAVIDGNTSVGTNLDITGTTLATGLLTASAGVAAASYAAPSGTDVTISGTINGVSLETHIHVDAEARNTSGPQNP